MGGTYASSKAHNRTFTVALCSLLVMIFVVVNLAFCVSGLSESKSFVLTSGLIRLLIRA